MLQLTLLISIALSAVSSKNVLFFRKDYKYVAEFNAFYKFHWDSSGQNWDSVFKTCENEDAKIFYPSKKNEWQIIKNLTQQLNAKPNVTDIFVGLHDKLRLGEFLTIDGNTTPTPLLTDHELIPEGKRRCVFMNIETGSCKIGNCECKDTIAPFVCKRNVEDEPCPTIDRSYFYSKETNKCYKIHERKKTWQEAMQTCYVEGGNLVIVKDEALQKYITTILLDHMFVEKSDQNTPSVVTRRPSSLYPYENNAQYDNGLSEPPKFETFFIGFNKMFNGDDAFYTVKGDRINKAFIDNNVEVNSGECGVLRLGQNNKSFKEVTTSNCEDRLQFICEMQAKP